MSPDGAPAGGAWTELSFVVAEDEAGERLDRVLAARSGIARSRLLAESTTVDGVPARLKERVRGGCAVEAVVAAKTADAPQAADVEFAVLWEDDDLVVVDKPAGVTVHGTGARPSTQTLVAGLLARYPEIGRLAEEDAAQRPGIVHRLDRNTSGLLVVARTPRALSALRAMVARRELVRCYAALVAGTFDAPGGEIDAPIGRRPGSRTFGVRSGGREARTRYDVQAWWARPCVSALAVTLDTGRTHQIRVHLSAIGHPVVGDRAYRGATILGADRQFLHAHRLAFTHPFTQAAVDVVSPLPADLLAVLDAAGAPSGGALAPQWFGERAGGGGA